MANIRFPKLLSALIGMTFVLGFALIIFINPQSISGWVEILDNHSYALDLRLSYKPVSKETPVAIIDIDDESIEKEGRWPWPRNKMALLQKKLTDLGAKVIAYDILFSEPEANLASEVLAQIPPEEAALTSSIEKLKEQFNYDQDFATSLEQGVSVLGMMGSSENVQVGMLPSPFATLSKDIAEKSVVLELQGYIANLPQFQTAAKHAGFFNALPDKDGISRSTPLLFRFHEQIYLALSLEAVRHFLNVKKADFIIQKYEDVPIIEAIQLDERKIPLNAAGAILIPYRGFPFSFPYLSATKVLHDLVPKQQIANKLLFIGSSSTALKDLMPTPLYPAFPGVEIHASVAAGIIDNYLPFKPVWGKGVTVAMILFFGLILSCLLPFLGPISSGILCICLPLAIYGFDRWMWITHGIVLSVFLLIVAIVGVYLLDMVSGFFFETRTKLQLRSLFNQYVPRERIDELLAAPKNYLEGQNREISLLFVDIRNFTTTTERLSAPQVKEYLQLFLTDMTKVLFDYKGTIDKYMGDEIMAFWGAPLEDKHHALHAVECALAMQRKIKELDKVFQQKNYSVLHAGIGINTGQAHVGDMGSSFRRAYTAIGDTVNLASRLEGLTKYYFVEIIVGEVTYEQTKETFIYRKLDRIQVKGKMQAIDIYQPIGRIGAVGEEILEELRLFAEALQEYLKGHWNQGVNMFKNLSVKYPAKQELYQIYLDRMTHLKPEEWQGSFRFEVK